MKRGAVVALCLVPGAATAGGLFLPGSGAVSTSRAGAAVASAEGGEALGLNPAGLAKSKGTSITLSMAIIDYAMEFNRRGTYDAIADEALPYEGAAFPTVRNDASPSLGIGSFQPIPVIAIVSDLGDAVPCLTVAAGLYAPNAYPFRDLCTEGPSGCQKYTFNGDFNAPPPPSRYDVMYQEASVILPSIAAAYRITDQLDVGARFSAGFGHIKSTVALWGALNNYEEYVKKDGVIAIDAKDNFVPAFGLGATFRPTPAIELAANFSSQASINAKGDGLNQLGPAATLNDNPIVILPTDDAAARCATGGTRAAQKACVELALPMTATVGGRYKFFRANGAPAGDIELNVGWENWSAERATDYRVVVDGDVYLVDANGAENYAVSLKDSFVRHGFKDVFTARLGGSYHAPMNNADLIVRGGFGFDTGAAKAGWLRADVDGMARATATLGIGYKAKRWEVNIGGGAVFDLAGDVSGTCNPTGPSGGTGATFGCGPGGTEQDVDDRSGPDPITPVLDRENQAESPVNQGTYSGRYLLFMLGASTWF